MKKRILFCLSFILLMFNFVSAEVLNDTEILNIFLEIIEAKGFNAENININFEDGIYKVSSILNEEESLFLITSDGEYLISRFELFSELINTEINIPNVMVINKSDADYLILKLAESQGVNIELINTEIKNGLYKVNILVEDEELYSLYLTLNGKYFIENLIHISDVISSALNNPIIKFPQEAKSNFPDVNLFIMSYCPYSAQAIKEIIPTIKYLGDEIHFSLRFINYTMHGKKELIENLRMFCIQETQNNKLLDYLECFYNIESEDKSKYCLIKTQINEEELNNCFNESYERFEFDKILSTESDYYPFEIDGSYLNEEYGVMGSPTLIINGFDPHPVRTSEGYLKSICSTFNEKPNICSKNLSNNSNFDDDLIEENNNDEYDSNNNYEDSEKDDLDLINENISSGKSILHLNNCFYEDKYYNLGYRIESQYCEGGSLEFKPQKESGLSCENSFECKSNVCINSKCIDPNLIQRIINWLSKIFS